jgi:hypothetical protein
MSTVEEKAWKGLETRLHALAEDFTQGRYGKGGDVDLDSLRSDFEEATDNWFADLALDEDEE